MLGVSSSAGGRIERENPLNLSCWIELLSISETMDKVQNIIYYYNQKHVSEFNLTSEISRWRSLLRHCATNRQVTISIPDCVIGIFRGINPSARSMTLKFTQKWVSGIFPEGKGGRCVGLINLPPSSTDCLQIWKPQPPGTLRACPGIDLPSPFIDIHNKTGRCCSEIMYIPLASCRISKVWRQSVSCVKGTQLWKESYCAFCESVIAISKNNADDVLSDVIRFLLQHSIMKSGVPRRPSKILPNSTRLWKLLKIAEFPKPAPQDIRKTGSKILKLPPVRNCFTLAMTNKLVVIINSLKLSKIKKILLYEISCTKSQLPPEPLTRGQPPTDPISLCPLSSTELVEPPPRTKFLSTPLVSRNEIIKRKFLRAMTVL